MHHRNALFTQRFGCLCHKVSGMTDAQHRNVIALTDQPCLANRYLLKRLLPVAYHTCPPRITDAERTLHAVKLSSVHHVAKFNLIHRGSSNHSRNVSHKCDIKKAVVCCTVGTYQAPAVHAEDHFQTLDGHIVDYLVISPLHERGIDIAEGEHPVCCHSG